MGKNVIFFLEREAAGQYPDAQEQCLSGPRQPPARNKHDEPIRHAKFGVRTQQGIAMSTPSPVMFSIRDFSTGSEIISRFPLANPAQAIHDINRLLDSLLASPPDTQTYFQILEHARLPITFVAEELAKRYVNKPIPLGDIEDGFFRQIITLWLKAAKAHAHCAEGYSPEAEGFHTERFATLLHRCIHFTGMAILEHQRARREVPWGLWLDLHGYYGTAEEWQVTTLAVPDALEAQANSTHCAAAYLAFILCDMAGCYSLPLRDQSLIRRWALAWSPLVSLHGVSPGESLPAFVIDLIQDVALRPVSECLHTDQLRRLDTSRLAIQIGHLRQQLRQRIPPAQLGLGEDCTPQQCARLLDLLARQWSQARAARKYRRRATSGITRICTGFADMHFFISGKEFEQPENIRIYSRREFDNLFSFRFQENPQQVLQIQQEKIAAAYSVDTWEVVNQSANGFRLVRTTSGRKMVHGQILALCPHDSERFLLAQAVWLMQEGKGGLIAGVKALPGLPAAICARAVDASGEANEPYQRAFLLPALASVNAEQSVVLPTGWFRPGRIIEVYSDGPWRMRLRNLLDLGPDFERVSFDLC